MEVPRKRRLVYVQDHGIFGKLYLLVKHYTALIVDSVLGQLTW